MSFYNKPKATDRYTVQDFEPSFGSKMSAAVNEAWKESYLSVTLDAFDQLNAEGPKLSAQEATDYIAQSKVPVKLTPRDNELSKGQLDVIIERQRELAVARDIRERTPWDWGSPLRGIAMFGAGIADPINLGTAFVPWSRVMPLARTLEAARLSSSAATRFAGRAGMGAIDGGITTAALEPFYAATRANVLGDDYTAADSMANIAFGTAFGGGVLGIGGVGVDAFRKATGRAIPSERFKGLTVKQIEGVNTLESDLMAGRISPEEAANRLDGFTVDQKRAAGFDDVKIQALREPANPLHNSLEVTDSAVTVRGIAGMVKAAVDGAVLTIDKTTITPAFRNSEHGAALLERMVNFATDRGLEIQTSNKVSKKVVNAINALEQKGFEVTRSPDAKVMRDGSVRTKKGAAYTIREPEGYVRAEDSARATVERIDPETRQAGLQAAVAQLAEGYSVDVEPIINTDKQTGVNLSKEEMEARLRQNRTPENIRAADTGASEAIDQEISSSQAWDTLDDANKALQEAETALSESIARGDEAFKYSRAAGNAEKPGVGVAEGNKLGFEPALRVKPKLGNLKLPQKPLILTGTNNKNAARQIDQLDKILDKFPKAGESAQEWAKMMAYAFASDEVPIPPYAFLRDINSDNAATKLGKLTKGQIADAQHGFDNAAEFRSAYVGKQLDVVTTGKLFMWSFLSRGVSPYVQESLFIDAFPGIDEWIRKAAAGEFTKDDFVAYEKWAKSVAPKGGGQPGAGATHNLNAFGKSFLFKMGAKGEDGMSHLQRLHDMMEDPNATGQEIRREFTKFGEGVGIDNKVVSFTLLVAGFDDVMVLDRVQIRQLFDDGRFNGKNLYDGRKEDGKPVTGSSLADLTMGARGLLLYEGIERTLTTKVKDIYKSLGRPEDASIGRYHWESWVADSQQEASHGTLGAILPDAKGDDMAIARVTAKQGEYGAYEYGAMYGRDEDGTPFFGYTTPDGVNYEFTVPAFREFLTEIKKPAAGVVPTKFKVTESGNAPWFQRQEVNQGRLSDVAAKWADRKGGTGEGVGIVQEALRGEAAADGNGPRYSRGIDGLAATTPKELASRGQLRQARTVEQDIEAIKNGESNASYTQDPRFDEDLYEDGFERREEFIARLRSEGLYVYDDVNLPDQKWLDPNQLTIFFGKDKAAVDALIDAETGYDLGKASGYPDEDIAKFYERLFEGQNGWENRFLRDKQKWEAKTGFELTGLRYSRMVDEFEVSQQDRLVEEVQFAFGSDAQRMLDAGQIQIVNTVDEIPNGPHPQDVKGATAPDGTVYLVAENIEPNQVKGLILHEVGVHVGMENMLGKNLFTRVLNELDDAILANKPWAQQARDSVPEDTPANLIREEQLAYLVENAPELPLVKRVIAAIRAWAFKNFAFIRDNITLQEADYQALASSALKKVARDQQMDAQPTTVYSRGDVEDVKSVEDEVTAADAELNRTRLYAGVLRAAADKLDNDAQAVEAMRAQMPDITAEEIDMLLDGLRREVKGLRQVSRAAREAVKAGDEIALLQNEAMKAADNLANNLEQAAVIQRRNKALSLNARVKASAFVKQFKDKDLDFEGFAALLVGSERVRDGSRLSVDAEYKGFRGEFIGGMVADIEKLGMMREFVSGQFDKDMYQALWQMGQDKPDFTGIPDMAVKMADVINKYQTVSRNRRNRFGAWIRDLKGYITKQSHDMYKIRDVPAEEWATFVRDRLDMKRMINMGLIDEMNPKASLLDLYNDFASGQHMKPQALEDDTVAFARGANLAKKESVSRALYFKDGLAAYEYNKKFGTGNLAESVIQGLEHSARSAALMKLLGTNPEATVTAVLNDYASTLPPDRRYKLMQRKGAIMNLLAQVDGSINIPGSVNAAKVGAFLRAWQSMAKLGGALVSSISDTVGYAAELRYAGDKNLLTGVADSMKALVSRRGQGTKADVLTSLGIFHESVASSITARFDNPELVSGKMAAAMQAFFRLNGLTWWTESLRDGAALAHSGHLARNSKKSYAALPEEIQRLLKLYNIDEQKWDIIRYAKTVADDGKEYLAPNQIGTIPRKKLEAYIKSLGRTVNDESVQNLIDDLSQTLRTMFIDRAHHAVIEPNARARAFMLRGTKPGTVSGEILRYITQFKSFSVSMVQMTLGREVYGRGYDTVGEYLRKGRGDMLGLASMIGLYTMMGYAAMAAKDMLKGREPRDPKEPKTWFAAAAQGGGLGLYGDFLFGEFNRFGGSLTGSLAGPVAGNLDGLADLWTRVRNGDDTASAAFKMLVQNTPFMNLFWIKPALDYMVLYRIQEALNPGYLRRMESRVRRENNQEFYLKPSQYAR